LGRIGGVVLTLADVAADPGSVTSELVLPSGMALVLRPLEPSDRGDLAAFFDGLSARSRLYGGVSDDTSAQALELCDAIGRYDKLRLVLCGSDADRRILGLLELSFDVVEADVERFRGYGVDLGAPDARFGLCIADDIQGTGAAGLASTATFDVARAFGRTRLILWGGVHDDNVRARRFYRRLGFAELEEWVEPTGRLVHDGLLEL
jgi:GNAT superfamily N-acetyltransferase